MANVNPSNSGSGEFSAQHAALPHLIKHGLSAEVADVRKDISTVLKPDAAITVDEFSGPTVGSVLLTGETPKVRAGLALLLFEIMDGSSISPTTGTLTQPGGHGTPWVYTPATAPIASTAAVVTGTADLSASALYGTTGTLNGLTLVLTVNGKYNSLTLNNETSPLNVPPPSPTVLNPPKTILQHIAAAFPGLTPTLNGSNFLVLTDKLSGLEQTIVVGAGTANTLLGLTAASHAGTGHSYAIWYEYDATLIANASVAVQGGPAYVNTNQGP